MENGTGPLPLLPDSQPCIYINQLDVVSISMFSNNSRKKNVLALIDYKPAFKQKVLHEFFFQM